MTQPNMRRLLKQPHLSLRDGGEVSPWSLRGIIQNVQSAVTPTPPTPEQAQRARELADYKARAEAARSAPAQPAPAAPAQAAAPALTQYGNGDITAQRMKAAGLRDGGDLKTGHGGNVPGTGSGDKIPAKYEPGEFVVSNAMLDAAPGLREELHDLRGNVLARQGKSVAQADAEAVTPTGLRANRGLTPYVNHRMGDNAAQMMSSERAVGPNMRPNFVFGDNSAPFPPKAPGTALVPTGRPGTNGYKPNFTMGANPSAAPIADPALPYDKGVGARAAEASAQAAHEAEQLAAAKANAAKMTQQARAMPANAGPSGPPRGYRTGQAAAGLLKKAPIVGEALSIAAEAGDVAEVAMDKDSSKLDVATQTAEGAGKLASGYLGAKAGAAAGALAGAPFAGVGAGPGALIGGALGGAAGYFGSGALIDGLRGKDTLSPHDAMLARRAGGTSAPSYTPRPDSVAPWGNEAGRRVSNINAPGGNVRGTEDFTKPLSTVPADLPSGLRDGMVYKTKGANGETVYSGRNVSGDVSGRMLNGDGTSAGKMRGSVDTSAGAPTFGGGGYVIDDQAPTGAAKQAQISATLRNPDGSQWSTRDNAVMAANLRDGVDPYRGTSRQPQGQGQDDPLAALRAKAMDSNAIGHNGAARMLIAAEQNQALREGHRMNYDAAMAGHNMTRNDNLARLQYDMNKDQRDFQTGRSDKYHEQSRQAEDDFQKHAVEATTGRGPDGKPMQDPTAAADYMRTVRHTIAQTIQDPNTPPEVREKLRSKGLAGLDVADRAAFANMYKTRQIQTADHGGINPFKSKGDVSDDLRDYKPNGEDNTLLQKRVRNNMGSVPVTSLQYGPNANHIGWNSGPADQTLVPKKLRD